MQLTGDNEGMGTILCGGNLNNFEVCIVLTQNLDMSFGLCCLHQIKQNLNQVTRYHDKAS